VRTSTIYSASGVNVGQAQQRWSTCYYGSSWSRTCVKVYYEARYSVVYRNEYTSPDPGYGVASTLSTTTNGNQCSGYVAWGYSGVVFNNCYAAGFGGNCRAQALGQVFQNNNFIGEALTGSY
jgi:hypothetical protein